MQIGQLHNARELAQTAEQQQEAAEALSVKAAAQQKRGEQHRAVASRLAIDAASADVDAQRAQRAGELQAAVEMHARCEHLQQLAGAEDACMGRALKQVGCRRLHRAADARNVFHQRMHWVLEPLQDCSVLGPGTMTKGPKCSAGTGVHDHGRVVAA